MYEFSAYLGVLLLMFIVGCLVSQIAWATRTQPMLPAPSSPVVLTRSAPREHWRRITAGKVSFEVPADMIITGSPGNEGIVQALVKDLPDYLYLYYAYGKGIPTDANPLPDATRQLTIDGHVGILNEWRGLDSGVIIRAGDDMSGMQLVIRDVGDGPNKFELYCVSYDIERVRQVMDTVRIQP